MSNILRVQWTIVPRSEPQPWLNCSRCREPTRFRCSGKIRVNANGRRIDAWLIYRCALCDSTWNRPILERRPIGALDPLLLRSLQGNEPGLVRRLAFDVGALRRWARRVEEFDDVLVTRDVLSESTRPIMLLKIDCHVPEPIGLRLDRLLASELHLSRAFIQRLARSAEVVTDPPGAGLHQPVRDGMRIAIDASAIPASSLELAARAIGPSRGC